MKNKSKKSYYQVHFLPWAGIRDESKIKNESIRGYLQRYFQNYIDYQGNPVDSIVVCSYEKINFKPLSSKQLLVLRNAVNILIFCIIAPAIKNAICANNRGMGPASADGFELMSQNFNPNTSFIAIQAGNSRHIWEIGEVKFSKPWALGGIMCLPNRELLIGFNKLLNESIMTNTKEGMFRSLEWFRLAHIENDVVSPFSKIIMMATVFEILLQVPNTRNKKGWI
ncbi:unnamed protein product, partial [marine sediment metagenome]